MQVPVAPSISDVWFLLFAALACSPSVLGYFLFKKRPEKDAFLVALLVSGSVVLPLYLVYLSGKSQLGPVFSALWCNLSLLALTVLAVSITSFFSLKKQKKGKSRKEKIWFFSICFLLGFLLIVFSSRNFAN